MSQSNYISPDMHKKIFNDPRIYQITILSCLIIYGLFFLDFEIKANHLFIILSTTLITQYLCTKLFTDNIFDPKSCLISGLSLCLLLRTGSPYIAIFCAVITISSKFIFRFNEKHIFNPTNFGLVIVLLLFNNSWISPGQWGNAANAAFFIACFGLLVVNRASRSDITYSFLIFYSSLIFGRAIWLGDPISIPIHQLQNGAFLIFTFFMISDPKTTPDARTGRILFALLVAIGAYYINFILFKTNGLIFSLAFFALSVPFIDFIFSGQKYHWNQTNSKSIQLNNGEVPVR